MEYLVSAPQCPFCGFESLRGNSMLLLHIEEHHPESEPSPTVTEAMAICPQDGCGDLVSQDDLAYHLQLHQLESKDDVECVTEEQQLPPAEEEKVAVPPRKASHAGGLYKGRNEKLRYASTAQKGWPGSIWKAFFSPEGGSERRETAPRKSHKSKGSSPTQPSENGGPSRNFIRLGKSELGRYAHEKEMPPWLVKLLHEEGQVVNTGVMPVLGQLLQQCPTTQVAYLCSPHVQHVSKLRREGGFCGYRNIQMLVSHIIGGQTTGSDVFGSTFPSIFDIQDLIENAWDMGFNSQGRIETGGVKGTRKYIGTPEAQAVFLSLAIPCSVQAFKDQQHNNARAALFEAIEQYFQSGVVDVEARIHLTSLPPLYLQHPRHSLTVVGLERQMNGEINLLVFDPSFHDSLNIRQLVGKAFQHKMSKIDEAIEPYRRGSGYLRKFNAFEVLFLRLDTPATSKE
ncbi:peptidase family C78-domain-containing protein [Mariannaea sp. PMI_226]|nr:peptidase family C78-domain-containing protein [Mariannaea sp. PMI_226]